MRLFVSGNEELARLLLPIAQSKVMEFAARCEKAGLKQNTYTFLFEDTGVSVNAQYAFGQLSMQLHAPFVQQEEDAEEQETLPICPRTFFIVTGSGYFWVIVGRDEDGEASVSLLPFTATVPNPDNPLALDYVYPGMGHQTAGMCAGTMGDQRYVVTQKAAVFTGECEEKGTVTLPASSEDGRITVEALEEYSHEYIVLSGMDFARSVKRISITADQEAEELSIDLKYAELDTILSAEGAELPVSVLHQNPCWIHRKCFGSYFSPNKTIGYHVDIGIDDDALGNMNSVTGGDLLDNDGGTGEALFNHTLDLYRITNIALFPISVSGDTVEILLVSPTMGVDGVEKCWGGYGIAQNDAGCADYRQDFSSWLLSPRPVRATVNLASGQVTYVDAGGEGASISFDAKTWDGLFSARMQYDREYSCDNDFYSDQELQEAGTPCRYDEECGGNCGVGYDPVGFNGTCPVEVTPWQHLALFFRENMLNSRRIFFCPGGGDPTPSSPQDMNGYYFMFDGFWHLDVGLHWSDQTSIGNVCTLCSVPAAGQNPGELIYFSVGSNVDPDWIMQNGHEYVKNLEVVLPLGYHEMPDSTNTYTTNFGFVARVPESLEAPHEPEIVTGGVEFTSPSVDGKIVKCERNLMSTPCDCDTNQMIMGQYSYLALNSITSVYVEGGCPPFQWRTSSGALFEDPAGEIGRGSSFLTEDRGLYVMSGPCDETVTITDACARQVSIMADITSPVMNGPDVLYPGSTGVYSLDIGTDAVSYSGTLEFVSKSGIYFTLRMPADACGDEYTVTLSGCGVSTTMKVRPTLGVWRLIYNGPYGGAGCMDFPPIPGENLWMDMPYTGAMMRSTAYHGKYYVQDFAGTYGITSGVFTAEECEEQFAIYGATQIAAKWPTTNVAEYLNNLFGNDPDVCLAKIPGYPFVRMNKSWSGRYGYVLFNNNWNRNIYEWVCT